MMYREILVHSEDPDHARREILDAGGRIRHALTSQLLVVALPDNVDIESIAGVSERLPELDEKSQLLAGEWQQRRSRQAELQDRGEPAGPETPLDWDTPGHTPPGFLVEDPGTGDPAPDVSAVSLRSTDTPTSVMLTGSVAVGLVVVSGPAQTPTWLPFHGALTYVSAAPGDQVWGVNADGNIYWRNDNVWQQVDGSLVQVSVGGNGDVWGVNASREIYRRLPNSWERISGSLKHVSVGDDGTVWGVNANDDIFRRDGSGWTRISGALRQISVGAADKVWGVNAEDEIYQRVGDDWQRISGSLRHVSAASDGAVYGVNANDEIFRRDGDHWVQLEGRLRQVSAASADLQWGVNADREIFTHDPSLSLVFTSSERSQLIGEIFDGLDFLANADPAANVSFVHDWHFLNVDAEPGNGHDYEPFEAPWRDAALDQLGFFPGRFGSIQYARSLRSERNTDWSYISFITKYPLHHFAYAGRERLVLEYANDNWHPFRINAVYAHEVCHIFGAADEYGGCECDASGHHDIPNMNCRNCVSDQLPCLMRGADLVLCPWSRGQLGWQTWDSIDGALEFVSVAADGTVWGVNADDDIFRRDGDRWERISGALKQISVGSADNVWGVNADDDIFRRDGDRWERISGALKHVSVAADGTVWGVNAGDDIFRRDGNRWERISGALKQVSVGSAGDVWGVNADDDIFRRDGGRWERISGALKHVSVAADGTVWGVNRSDRIYYRDGNRWRRVPGALNQVAAGSATAIWGVNDADNIYRFR